MSILYCKVIGKAINGTLIIKDGAEYGTAYMNIKDKKGEFYQIHGQASKEERVGGTGFSLSFLGSPNEIFYTINKFTKEVVFYEKQIASEDLLRKIII